MTITIKAAQDTTTIEYVIQRTVKHLTCFFRPWDFFSLNGYSVDNALDAEQNVFPQGKNLRQDAVTLPSISPIGRQYSAQYRTATTIGRTSVTLVERSPAAAPISFILYMAAIYFATDPTARTAFMERARSFGSVPKIFVEMSTKIRSSIMGNFILKPAFFAGTVAGQWIATNNAANTLLDYRYLATSQGREALFEFFSWLRTHPDNYIVFVPATDLADVDSGRMNTQCTMTTDNNMVTISSGHSYGSEVLDTHVNEAHISQQLITGNTIPVRDRYTRTLEGHGDTFEVVASSTSLMRFIILRGSGKLPNRIITDKDKGSTPPPPPPSSTPPSSPTPQPPVTPQLPSPPEQGPKRPIPDSSGRAGSPRGQGRGWQPRGGFRPSKQLTTIDPKLLNYLVSSIDHLMERINTVLPHAYAG